MANQFGEGFEFNAKIFNEFLKNNGYSYRKIDKYIADISSRSITQYGKNKEIPLRATKILCNYFKVQPEELGIKFEL